VPSGLASPARSGYSAASYDHREDHHHAREDLAQGRQGWCQAARGQRPRKWCCRQGGGSRTSSPTARVLTARAASLPASQAVDVIRADSQPLWVEYVIGKATAAGVADSSGHGTHPRTAKPISLPTSSQYAASRSRHPRVGSHVTQDFVREQLDACTMDWPVRRTCRRKAVVCARQGPVTHHDGTARGADAASISGTRAETASSSCNHPICLIRNS